LDFSTKGDLFYNCINGLSTILQVSVIVLPGMTRNAATVTVGQFAIGILGMIQFFVSPVLPSQCFAPRKSSYNQSEQFMIQLLQT